LIQAWLSPPSLLPQTELILAETHQLDPEHLMYDPNQDHKHDEDDSVGVSKGSSHDEGLPASPQLYGNVSSFRFFGCNIRIVAPGETITCAT
jgi:hypothetical protein